MLLIDKVRSKLINCDYTIEWLQIISDVTPILAALSENEATAFGKFLSLILETAIRWRSKEQIYDAVRQTRFFQKCRCLLF